MRKEIKVKFVDQWGGWSKEYSVEYRILAERYDVKLSNDPDFVFCQGLGRDHFRYDNAVKILANGENITPDFNLYDYAYGFDNLAFGDRYIRIPLYVCYDGYGSVCTRKDLPSDEQLLNRKFCSFVVSNATGDPARLEFFKQLSKYKQVDSGGRYLNNVGGAVSSKRNFCSQYKFNIAFENSCYPGYVTEKIMEPLSVWSVPIYYGAPDVAKDFSEGCFIHVRSKNDFDDAINRIIELDQCDEKYLEICKADRFVNGVIYSMDNLKEFLYSIIERGRDNAFRRAKFGMQTSYRTRLIKLNEMADVLNFPRRALRPVLNIFK